MVAVGSAGGNQAKSACPRGPASPGESRRPYAPRDGRPAASRWRHKRDAVRRLTKHCRCIAYVLRGLGASGRRDTRLGAFSCSTLAGLQPPTVRRSCRRRSTAAELAAGRLGPPGNPGSCIWPCGAQSSDRRRVRPIAARLGRQCLEGRAAQGVIHLPAVLVGGVRLSVRRMMLESSSTGYLTARQRGRSTCAFGLSRHDHDSRRTSREDRLARLGARRCAPVPHASERRSPQYRRPARDCRGGDAGGSASCARSTISGRRLAPWRISSACTAR
jgi:hypothetical protein